MDFNHASFFSGIGGADLAAEWMGWNNIAHCEINPFCRKVLSYYWSKAKSYEDITKTDFTELRGTINIVSGGFPCQPYSLAGQRRGKEDERHLWPHYLRAIREIQPPWVVGENVRGLVNWSGGLVFDEIQADLEAEGYEVIPFTLPACAVDAPHERERIWFIAFNSDFQRCQTRSELFQPKKERQPYGSIDAKRIIADTDRFGSERWAADRDRQNKKKEIGSSIFKQADRPGKERIASDSFSIRLREEKHWLKQSGVFDHFSTPGDWRNFPTQSPICFGNDGLSSQLDGITFSKWRRNTLEAGGNAIVPQVIYEIFKAIETFCNIHQ